MRKLTIACVLLGFIAGCGQTGPLYHPEPEPQPEQAQPEKDTNKQEDTK